jgi:hypothetical protein
MNGIKRKIPGPLNPINLPNRKITALSYSGITFIVENNKKRKIASSTNDISIIKAPIFL